MRTTVSILIGLALILGFLVYAFWHSARTNSPIQLTPAMFTDYEFTLISDKRYADYLFVGSNVKGDSGWKNEASVGFDYDWKIKDGNTLVFTDVDITPAGTANLEFSVLAYPNNVVFLNGVKFNASLPDKLDWLD